MGVTVGFSSRRLSEVPRELPGVPVAKSLNFYWRGHWFSPWLAQTKILYAMLWRSQNKDIN